MKQRKSLSIGMKFFIAFLAVVVLLLGSGIYSDVNMKGMSDGYEQVFDKCTDKSIMLANMQNDLLLLAIQTDRAVYGSDDNASFAKAIDFGQIQSVLEESIGTVDDLIEKLQDKDNDGPLLEIKEGLQSEMDAAQEIMGMIDAGQHDKAVKFYESEMADLENSLNEKISSLIDEYEGYTKQGRTDVADYAWKLRVNTLVMMAVIAVIIIILAAVFAKAVQKPITAIAEVAKKLAVGDIEAEKLTRKSNDEIGTLVDCFNSIIDRMKWEVDIAEKVAVGDLTVDVEIKSDKDELGKTFKKMIAGNNRTLGNINESASQVDTGSQQVAIASQSLAQGSTEQASAVEEVTATIGDITERTRANASNAAEAEKLVSHTKADAQDGNAAMREMLEAMDEITQASENISKIIKTIDDIAFQTNILALNAAVEAARAGDHGKGFAVVAEEVRNLAAKSAAAASETSEMIEDSIAKTTNGSDIAERTAGKLSEIVDAVDKIFEYVTSIAQASTEQADALVQVDKAIEQVSTVVQNNSATSQQCAAASEELSNQAKSLKKLISVYKLKDVSERRAALLSDDGDGPADGIGGSTGSFTADGMMSGRKIPDASDFGNADYAENESIISLEDNGYSKY